MSRRDPMEEHRMKHALAAAAAANVIEGQYHLDEITDPELKALTRRILNEEAMDLVGEAARKSIGYAPRKADELPRPSTAIDCGPPDEGFDLPFMFKLQVLMRTGQQVPEEVAA